MTWVLAFLTTTGVAQAQDFCTDLQVLMDQSRAQFAEIAGKPSGNAGDHEATLTLTGASYCTVTKKSKRSTYLCGWEFPHRAEHAYGTFDGFVRKVDDCIGRQATVHSDQSVNHPDYYASRRYEMEQAEVSVSVKDKGALGSTFVFVRVQSKSSN